MAAEYGRASDQTDRRIIICTGTGCVANGSLEVRDRFVDEIRDSGINVVERIDEADPADGNGTTTHVSRSGCQGFCQMGPLVTIEPEGLMYVKVTPEDVVEIVEETVLNGRVVERLLYEEPNTGKRCRGTGDIPFYRLQTRRVLAECGRIDPEDIREYIHMGGYEAARKAYSMPPDAVCEEVARAGLRGRGGGGFPTGRKWELTLQEEAEKKFVICNGDEGDPGAFMDRSVMEGNPHAVIEGMMIAARAIGADQGYIYVRAEYPLAVKRTRKAVRDAEEMGLLGEDLFGTGRALTLEVMEGAGAFVCGEETALMASIEGRRGMPMPKPPFPAQSGLQGQPTVINNVETLASVPRILREGAEEFRKVGTEDSPGTKTFALTGYVANTGLIEVPFGTTLREVVFDIGGGVTEADGGISEDAFKAVQIGGPSGGCLTSEHLDMPLDFDSLAEVGAMVGSGGLVVINQNSCMVNIAHFFMRFTQHESCGKCVLCREGTRQMLSMLDDITEGEAEPEDLENLEKLARTVKKGSLCGLGKTAPSPVLSTMRYFSDEYEAHVRQKRCPAGECKALQMPEIDPDRCKGCTVCARKCPVDAIAGEVKEPHTIDPELCTRCGTCAEVCKFDAITGV
jgi:NADH-quinone oxidoreductase subunit F